MYYTFMYVSTLLYIFNNYYDISMCVPMYSLIHIMFVYVWISLL